MEPNQEDNNFFDDVDNEKEIDQNNQEILNNNIKKNEKLDVKELLEFQNPSKLEENNSEEVSLENIDEDLYMQELYLRLTQMKQERKQAEENAKLLDNRLNLLKGEEIKTLKKIEITKKKANDKFQNLKFIAQNRNIKLEAKKKKEKDLVLKKEQNKLMNKTIKNNTEKNKEKLKRQIEEEAKLLKIQKIYNKQLINFLNEEKMNENKAKCANIKNEKSYYNEKKRILENEKKRKLREELEKKLIEEYKLKEIAENKRIKAEKQEIEIIKKLQNTTKLQQNITDEFEKMNIDSVMRGDYENFNNKYNSNDKRKNKRKENDKIK
jgi:hypothetical protein